VFSYSAKILDQSIIPFEYKKNIFADLSNFAHRDRIFCGRRTSPIKTTATKRKGVQGRPPKWRRPIRASRASQRSLHEKKLQVATPKPSSREYMKKN
jgi:hypothetical protein